MLAVPDRGELGELAGRREQRHARVPEPERREPLELLAEVERQLVAAHDGVDGTVTGGQLLRASAPAACSANASANASTFSGAIESPAAAR